MPKILMAEYMPWNGIQVGGHKYARAFLDAGWEVFWLANFLNINRLIRRREDDRIFIANWRSGIVSPTPNLYTYTPLTVLPYIDFPGLDSWYVANHCLQLTLPGLRRALQASGFDRVDVLWLTHPRLVSILNIVEHDILIHRMADEVTQFMQEPRTIEQAERDICRRAELVFCTAHSLVKKAESWGATARYLPNGVDFDIFSAEQSAEPLDLQAIPHPRLLYVGAISDWLDMNLLLQTAQRRRDLSIVLVGPVTGSKSVSSGVARLTQEPNIHFLGSKPFSDVPAYMRFCDVGLIPFQLTPLTHAINPIKLFEYSACALPVVAANLHETQRLGSPALLYNALTDFLECIEQALSNGEALGQQGVAFARCNSWQSRFNTVQQELHQLRQ